jgi:hypothetical protein
MDKNIIMFAMGAVLGMFVTAVYLNDKHRRFLEEETEYFERIIENIKSRLDKEDTKEDLVPFIEDAPKDENKVLVMSKDRYKKVIKNYREESEFPREEDIIEKPYVITFEEFCEGYDNHDKITINYYKADDTLADENEEIIDDVESLIGEESLSRFGDGSEDPNVVYVRNERMAIDYEIIKLESSYSEVVSGCNEET